MTEENRQERWSISPDFAKFLLTILGTFVGSLIALSLYGGLINPPKQCPMYPPPSYYAPMYYGDEYVPECPYKKHKMKPYKNFKMKHQQSDATKADNADK